MPNWMQNILMIHRFVFIVCLSTFDSYSFVHVSFIYFSRLCSRKWRGKKKSSFCSRHHHTHSQTKIDWKFTQNKLLGCLMLFKPKKKKKRKCENQNLVSNFWIHDYFLMKWTVIGRELLAFCDEHKPNIILNEKMHRWNNWKRRTPKQNVSITILVVSSLIILIVSCDQNGCLKKKMQLKAFICKMQNKCVKKKKTFERGNVKNERHALKWFDLD